MKRLAALAVVCAISGCAFQGAKEKAALVGALTLSADWGNGPTEQLGTSTKAHRGIVAVEAGHYLMDAPITLPVDAPKTVVMALELPGEALTQDLQFTRAKVSILGVSYQLVSQILQWDGLVGEKRRVLVSVSGLNALFAKDHAGAGGLTLELYGATTRLAAIDLALRTPPSGLEVGILSLRDFQTQASDGQKLLTKPAIGDQRLNLLRVIAVKNNESTQVALSFSRRPGASVSQWVNPIVHHDLGCSYSLSENPHVETFSQDVLALPMDERFFDAATPTLAQPDLKDQVTINLAPGTSRWIGYYGLGAATDGWMDQGPLGPQLQVLSVQNDCFTVCLQQDCGGPHFQEVEPRGCFCQREEKRRHDALVTIGTNRASVLLSVPAEQTSWTARYSDLDVARDGETRPIAIQSPSSELQWF